MPDKMPQGSRSLSALSKSVWETAARLLPKRSHRVVTALVAVVVLGSTAGAVGSAVAPVAPRPEAPVAAQQADRAAQQGDADAGREAAEKAAADAKAGDEPAASLPASTPSAKVDGDQLPSYDGSPYSVVNDNVPAFSADDLNGPPETYAPLDGLDRCGVTLAVVSRDTMPTEKRGSIGMVKPSGWHTVRYDDLVEGKYLYNRCHLIGYQLTAENANQRNLITGTRYLNVKGMLPFEERVASYVKSTGNRVLYRATPVFVGSELVARGVQLEAWSVEDKGQGVSFNVFCHNVQPGIAIDYATGDSAREDAKPGQSSADAPAAAARSGQASAAGDHSGVQDSAQDYVLNTNTHKFHRPDCRHVDQIKPHNRRDVHDTRDSVIGQGYKPCKKCNP
ncbi:DNA/RNA non-specific endonuclease [Berryella wangjianweii]|uniref:DNA/RNA non-specific endonuclease n=1 Tax=Berryella wangjianweii TaxID=2734634 RepID=UPI0021BD8AA1|nr:DNA/RNA non-specific endonuclease [Berryella wangjianweii]